MKDLKTLLKENKDKALKGEVILIEKTERENGSITWELSTRVELPIGGNDYSIIKLSNQRYDKESETYVKSPEQEAFIDEINKEIFKGKLDDFTGVIDVFPTGFANGNDYQVYPYETNFVKATPWEDFDYNIGVYNQKKKCYDKNVYTGIVKGLDFSESFGLSLYIQADLVDENNQPVILKKKIAGGRDFQTKQDMPLNVLKGIAPFEFKKKLKKIQGFNWSDSYLEKQGFTDMSDKNIKVEFVVLSMATGATYIQFV